VSLYTGGAGSIATESGNLALESGKRVVEVASLSDAEAVYRARDGDHDAFRVLVERYQERAFRLALRVLRDEEQARDAVQDAFLKVYGALDRFEGRSGFYTWLYRVVFNRCLDLQRRERARPALHASAASEESGGEEAMLGEGAEEGVGASRFASPESRRSDSELRVLLVDAVEALPDDARQTFLLREVDGLSYSEIAEVLDVPKGTVMSRLHYARKRLRETLVAAGLPAGNGEAVEESSTGTRQGQEVGA
jgi:RNA polymerase sigma-70 factor (ECF subfamily)